MALVMQTYDKPTETWLDVVSVTQEVFGGGGAPTELEVPLAMVTEGTDIFSISVEFNTDTCLEVPLTKIT